MCTARPRSVEGHHEPTIGSIGSGYFLLQKRSAVLTEAEKFDIDVMSGGIEPLRLNFNYVPHDPESLSQADAQSFFERAAPEIEATFPAMRALSNGAHGLLYLTHYGVTSFNAVPGVRRLTAEDIGTCVFSACDIIPLSADVDNGAVTVFNRETAETLQVPKNIMACVRATTGGNCSLDDVLVAGADHFEGEEYWQAMMDVSSALQAAHAFGLVHARPA